MQSVVRVVVGFRGSVQKSLFRWTAFSITKALCIGIVTEPLKSPLQVLMSGTQSGRVAQCSPCYDQFQ